MPRYAASLGCIARQKFFQKVVRSCAWQTERVRGRAAETCSITPNGFANSYLVNAADAPTSVRACVLELYGLWTSS